MHFLCLHGIGTNNKIFQMQTSAIRYELGDHHTYEFVEGTIPWSLAPETKSFFATGDEYYCYFDPTSSENIWKAVDALDAYIATEGPFDAVMAFSQGALLASTFIAQKVKQNQVRQSIDPVFKCAVFFSGGIATKDDALPQEQHGPNLAKYASAIPIPTANVWGSKDQLWPGRALTLSAMCKVQGRTIYTHEGGHEIPTSKSKAAVTGIVHAIRRTVDSANFAQ